MRQRVHDRKKNMGFHMLDSSCSSESEEVITDEQEEERQASGASIVKQGFSLSKAYASTEPNKQPSTKKTETETRQATKGSETKRQLLNLLWETDTRAGLTSLGRHHQGCDKVQTTKRNPTKDVPNVCKRLNSTLNQRYQVPLHHPHTHFLDFAHGCTCASW